MKTPRVDQDAGAMTGMEVPVATSSTPKDGSSNLKARMEDIRCALSHSELTSRQQRLLAILLTYMPFDGGGWPLSTGRLAGDLYGDDNRTSRKNTSTVLRRLRELGFVTTEERTNVYNRQGSNRVFVEVSRLYVYDFAVTSTDVTVKSTDVTMDPSDVTVGGPISSSHIHQAPSSDPQEHRAHVELSANDESTKDSHDLEHLPPPSVASLPPLATAPGSEGRGPSLGQAGCVGVGPDSDGRLETDETDGDPAWRVEADLLTFRPDWDGTPDARELTRLHGEFHGRNARLAQLTTEEVAQKHPDDLQRAIAILRNYVA